MLMECVNNSPASIKYDRKNDIEYNQCNTDGLWIIRRNKFTVVATGASTSTRILYFEVLVTCYSSNRNGFLPPARATLLLPSPGTYTIRVTDLVTDVLKR